MKKILYLILGVALVTITSCMKVDNWDEPGVRVYGRVIDSYTGENILSSQGEWGIRIWERTWTESVPNNQSLAVKQDGSFNNSKLFAGTYDMLPYGGPFWPCDTIKGVKLGSSAEQNFTVTPYLQLIDFQYSLTGLKLTLKCRLKAPRREGLPNLVEIKPFLSLTTFCGASSFIDIGEYNNTRKQINRSWMEEVGDVDESGYYRIGPLPVKAGYTYYVRLGANVNDANRKYNYSEIVKVEVPADAVNDPNEVPDNYLTNAQWPFSKTDWDGNRWGNLTGWTTNEAMRNRGDHQWGGYDGGWEGPANDKQSLGFEHWNNGETAIVNGKLYQTINLPVGDFALTLNFGGDCPIKSNSGNDPRYIVAAVGETLPDIENIASALGSRSFAGLNQDNGTASVEFSLTAPTKVSVGFLTSLTGDQQNVRPSSITLKKL